MCKMCCCRSCVCEERAWVVFFFLQNCLCKLVYHHCCWPQCEWHHAQIKMEQYKRPCPTDTQQHILQPQTQPHRHEAQQHDAGKHIRPRKKTECGKMVRNPKRWPSHEREKESQMLEWKKRRAWVAWGRGWNWEWEHYGGKGILRRWRDAAGNRGGVNTVLL